MARMQFRVILEIGPVFGQAPSSADDCFTIAKKAGKILLLNFDNGEFDPGSERTLAAWIRHASRTRKLSSESEYSGERVSNRWKTCPTMGDNSSNELLIPHTTFGSHVPKVKGGLSLKLPL